MIQRNSTFNFMDWPYNMRKPGALCSKQYNSWKPDLLLPILSGNTTYALLTRIILDGKDLLVVLFFPPGQKCFCATCYHKGQREH